MGEFKGTYQVEPDCSGKATFWFNAASNATIRFVIVDSGKRVEMIVTDQGVIEIGTATRIVTDPAPATAPKPVTPPFE